MPPGNAGSRKHLTLFAGLAAIMLAGWLCAPNFLTFDNQRNVLANVSINGILAVGMTLVILTAGIDLSVGSVMSLCTVVCAMLIVPAASGADGISLPGWIAGWAGVEPINRAHIVAVLAGALWTGLLGGALARRLGAARRRKWLAVIGGSLAAVIGGCAVLHFRGYATATVIVVVPLVGAMLGAASGCIIAGTRLQPFIVTLAMMISAVGLAKYIAGEGGIVHSIIYESADGRPGPPASFRPLGESVLTVAREELRSGKVREVKLLPVPGLFFIGCWLAGLFVLTKLPVGRYVYAVGGSEETARLSGLPVAGVKIFVYALSGALAGLAGVLHAAQYGEGRATAGQMKELDAIAAVVIGGTSLMGGRGSILGTLIGVMIFGYLSNILNLRAVSSEIQDILKGVIIVGAAALQSGHAAGGLRSLSMIWRRG